MLAFAIPRLDAGAEGLHLVWTWPACLPVSQGGWDIQRLEVGEAWRARCESIPQLLIAALRAQPEYAAPLGPLRLRSGVTFSAIGAPGLASPGGASSAGASSANAAGAGFASGHATAAAFTATHASAAPPTIDEFIQELTTPVDVATVRVEGRIAVAMALSAGKVVQVAVGLKLPATLVLIAPAIDCITVYVVEPTALQLCVYERQASDKIWAGAPYLVRGLTLPLREADPSLGSGVQEYAEASARLLAGEALASADFNGLAATLRAPLASAQGRPGERVVLVRADATQSFEELTLDGQLTALALHPRVRRVLGLGFRDSQGLVPGAFYSYRITGRFQAEDLTDAIYDVHRVPTSTVLPPSVAIRDLSLRFQTSVKVVLDPAPAAGALHATSRRGIRVDTTGYDDSWQVPSYQAWSALIDFPRPVSQVVLEVAPGHAFHYAAGDSWAFGAQAPIALPAGPVVPLAFAAPVTQLRLSGTGTLYAVRLPSGQSGPVEVHAYTLPTRYAPLPLPAPPSVLTAASLQQPPTVVTGPIGESTPVAPRPQPGLRLSWLPPLASGGLPVWPDDLDSGPPIDALAYQLEHRLVTPPSTYGAWEPIAGDDNLTLGSRDAAAPTIRLEPGCDLDELFPTVRARPAGSGLALHLSDVFGENDPATGAVRPVQPLGSSHQYQIRSIDAVGRVGATTTLSNVVRLEKHVPPPLPAGPQPEPLPDASGHLSAPPGPRARAIVAGQPGLTADDLTVLDGHQSAVLLEWGWRQQERDLDPTAAEFRVYSTVPPDVVQGTVTAVTSTGSGWQVAMTTGALPLVADELVGQWLVSGGHPFRIAQNDAGTTPTLLLERSALQPATQPVAGAVTFGRPLRPDHQRPAGWDARVAVYPLGAGDTYRHVFHDLLTLDPAHPRDGCWVGVSAADAEPYVPDERTAGPNSSRPGNESAIAACAVAARYQGQPVFSVPPPLGDVPEQVTDEPTGREVLVDLDLAALLAGALPAGAPVALERCSADDILSRTTVVGGDVVLSHPDGTQEVIAFANPADQAAALSTLRSSAPQRLASKYLMHLVAASGDPTVFFEPISGGLDQVGVVSDRLAPKPGRHLYFLRAADALGHLSEGGALLPLVVRVPSTASAAAPARRALAATDTAVRLTVAVPPDPDTSAALLFASIGPPGGGPAAGEAELLRLPNRRDLYPLDGLRLRLPDGTLLAPAVVKDLGDLDVQLEADGTRVATLSIPATRGTWATIWCIALSRDGFPSAACGPFGTGVRP